MRTAIIAAVILGAPCSSCHGRGEEAGPPSDAGAPIDSAAAVDAVSTDTAYDVGTVLDAVSGDAGDSPLSRGSWAGLSIFPDCPPSIAINPDVAIPPLTWVNCASGRAGCRELSVTWTSRTDIGPLRRGGYPGVRIVDGKPYFAHSRYSRDWMTFVVQEGLDGTAVFASTFAPYAPVSCALVANVGKAGVALIGSVNGKERPAGIDNTPILGAAPWGSFGAPSLRFINKADLGAVTESGGAVGILAGDRRAFIATYLPTTVQPMDMTTLGVTRSANSSAQPIVVPDGVLAQSHETFGLTLIRDDGSFKSWVAPQPVAGATRVISWHDFDQTTRDTVVWVECNNDDTASGAVLWSANYVADPTKIVKKRLGSLPSTTPRGGRGLVVNGGFVLITVADDRAALYRLSDGSGWSIAVEPGRLFAEPIWLDERELVVTTMKPSELPSGLLRIARDTLGTPTLKLE